MMIAGADALVGTGLGIEQTAIGRHLAIELARCEGVVDCVGGERMGQAKLGEEGGLVCAGLGEVERVHGVSTSATR